MEDQLHIAGKAFSSRLLLGSSAYPNQQVLLAALEAGGAEIVTVAVRRISLTAAATDIASLLHGRYHLLPNTAGCFTARDAVLTAQLAREALETDWIKLEVIGDTEMLYPEVEELLRAADQLVRDKFIVMAYCNDDPVTCRKLQDIGCAAVMPLASPIGSGLGLTNPYTLEMIRAQITVPLIVDAGIGTASDAAQAMELGFDGVLLNTAVAKSRDPVKMAAAMRHAVEGGRLAYQAGRIPKRRYAEPSSPFAGLINA